MSAYDGSFNYTWHYCNSPAEMYFTRDSFSPPSLISVRLRWFSFVPNEQYLSFISLARSPLFTTNIFLLVHTYLLYQVPGLNHINIKIVSFMCHRGNSTPWYIDSISVTYWPPCMTENNQTNPPKSELLITASSCGPLASVAGGNVPTPHRDPTVSHANALKKTAIQHE